MYVNAVPDAERIVILWRSSRQSPNAVRSTCAARLLKR